MTVQRTPKNDSYGIRRQIARAVGVPDGYDFSPASKGWTVLCWLEGEVEPAVLTSTSNAGFRGIEGTFETGPDDPRRYVYRSLGDVTDWEIQ